MYIVFADMCDRLPPDVSGLEPRYVGIVACHCSLSFLAPDLEVYVNRGSVFALCSLVIRVSFMWCHLMRSHIPGVESEEKKAAQQSS